MAQESNLHVPPFKFDPYQYSPLPSPTSIRLLRFVHNPPDHVAPTVCGIPLIECTLSAVDLENNPEYLALSYTWGNPQLVQPGTIDEYTANNGWPISINGRLAIVTRNLYEALQKLRAPDAQFWPNADERLEPYNKTPLIRAAEKGDTKAVAQHLYLGADVRCADEFGETALHYAAENGHLDVVRLLLRSGANPSVLDSSNRTPLDCCLQRQRGAHTSVAEALCDIPVEEEPISQCPEGWAMADRPTTTSSWWIDAVCIHQRDISERNSQVAMMARIYQTARTVIGWLGVADQAAGIVNDIFREAKAMKLEETKHCRTPATKNNHGLADGPKQFSSEQAEAIWSLLTRPWFQRTWIIQEVALGRNLMLYCGQYAFTWMDICSLLQAKPEYSKWRPAVESMQTKIYTGVDVKYGRGNCLTLAWCLVDIRLRCPNSSLSDRQYADAVFRRAQSEDVPKHLDPSQLSLPALMALTWNFAVSDPRDKIFALQNIARNCDDRHKITVDYNKSVVQVFTEMARMFIAASGDHTVTDWLTGKTEDFEPLEGLSFVQTPVSCESSTCMLHPKWRKSASEDELRGLPSWVPNFSRHLDTRRLYDHRFRAAGEKQAQIYPSDPTILRVDGLELDEIVEVVQTGYNRCAQLVMREYLRTISRMEPIYPTGISRVEALLRTLIADRWHGDDLKKSFKAYMTFHLFRCDDGEPDLDVLERLRETDASNFLPSVDEIEQSNYGADFLTDDDSEIREKWPYMSSVFMFQQNRCLVRTKDGYLGLAPRSTRVGDEMWLLGGFRTPVVLRRKSSPEQRQFIGEMYLHGLMNGEAAAGREDGFAPIDLV